MIRAIGFGQGQYGDLVVSTAIARAFKQRCPDSHLTLGVNRRYRAIIPLFDRHPYFDAVHVYTTYDGWPGKEDVEYLTVAGFDMVFNAMPAVPHDWFRHAHQTVAVGAAHGIKVVDETCELNQWFFTDYDLFGYIAFAPFAGNYSPGNPKALTIQRAQQIVDLIVSMGYKVLQLGGPGEPKLDNTNFPQTSYFDSVRAMLGCRLLIHTDTGLGWVASAYKHPQLGLYSHSYYGREFVGNIQPRNPHSIYLSESSLAKIELDSIQNSLNLLL